MKQLNAPATASPTMAGEDHASAISRRSFLSRMAFLPVPLLLIPGALKGQGQVVPIAPKRATTMEPVAPRGAGQLAPAPSQIAAQSPVVKRQTIIQVLEDAQLSGNMNGAIERFGKSLAVDEKRILLSLSADELAALRSARSKLKLRAAP
jgi:hypothetical protein